MENRKLKEPEQAHYFAPVAQVGDIEEGTKEMSPLYPFVVSGGKILKGIISLMSVQFQISINLIFVLNILEMSLLIQMYFPKELLKYYLRM